MSGIAGIKYLDNLLLDRADLVLMLDTLAHRGPDGADIWIDGGIGLGHRMLWTTPESLIEKQPLVDQVRNLAIAADARIDNREELISQLSLDSFKGTGNGERGTEKFPKNYGDCYDFLSDRPLNQNINQNNSCVKSVTDSQLILEAYKKWGEDCPKYLIGDFAFAIWDGCKQTLFCARDHFGVKPFYYYQSDRIFIFASEIKALLCLPQVPCQLNETRIGDYLTLMMEDKAIATYKDIWRLPPAHSMVITTDEICIRQYWELDRNKEIKLSSEEEYAQEFKKIFTEAVRCRLRSAFPIISHLSGGLDSSAVTCVARDLLTKTKDSQGENKRIKDNKLHTISSIFEKVTECDESPFINAVLEQEGVIPHYVRGDRFSPLSNLSSIFEYEDEALLGPSHFYPWQLNHKINELGLRISLDGFDGDTTVSHGTKRLSELAYQGKWETCIQESKAISKHFDGEAYRIFRTHCLSYLQNLARDWRWITFLSVVGKIHKEFGGSRKQLIIRYGVKPFIASLLSKSRFNLILNSRLSSKLNSITNPIAKFIPKLWLKRLYLSVVDNSVENSLEKSINPLVKEKFARRIGLLERIQKQSSSRKEFTNLREEHYCSLNQGILAYTLEQIDQYAARFSIEARHPFMDKRLIEFCLALPAEQKLAGGFGRIVMRRALTGILPEKVQWRGGKADLGPNFIDGLLVRDRQILDRLMSKQIKNLENYINIDFLENSYHRLISAGKEASDRDCMTVWKTVILALWLEHKQVSP